VLSVLLVRARPALLVSSLSIFSFSHKPFNGKKSFTKRTFQYMSFLAQVFSLDKKESVV
jgi:hypothetical protein